MNLNSPGLDVRQSPMSQLLQEAKSDSSKGRQEGWKEGGAREGGGRTYSPRNKQSMKINKKQQHTDVSASSVIVKTLQRKKTRRHNKGRFACLLKALRNPVQDRRVKGKCAFGLKNSSMSVGARTQPCITLSLSPSTPAATKNKSSTGNQKWCSECGKLKP